MSSRPMRVLAGLSIGAVCGPVGTTAQGLIAIALWDEALIDDPLLSWGLLAFHLGAWISLDSTRRGRAARSAALFLGVLVSTVVVGFLVRGAWGALDGGSWNTMFSRYAYIDEDSLIQAWVIEGAFVGVWLFASRGKAFRGALVGAVAGAIGGFLLWTTSDRVGYSGLWSVYGLVAGAITCSIIALAVMLPERRQADAEIEPGMPSPPLVYDG